MHMHSSCLWDTETTRFNCVMQSDPYSHTWQQQYCSISQRWYFTTCRMHWQHEDRLMYFQSRKHRGHSYMCPARANTAQGGPKQAFPRNLHLELFSCSAPASLVCSFARTQKQDVWVQYIRLVLGHTSPRGSQVWEGKVCLQTTPHWLFQ